MNWDVDKILRIVVIILKIVACIFILRVCLYLIGINTYIPIANEIVDVVRFVFKEISKFVFGMTDPKLPF